MAAMEGFSHRCDCLKVRYEDFKGSLKDSAFDDADISLIWDFYVTHAFTGSSRQERSLRDYGWEDKEYDNLENSLMASAAIERLCCIRSHTIKDTLEECDLSNSEICITHPRAVLQRSFNVKVDENENMKYAGGTGAENRIICLFRHIRNAFAHSNTYFFENGNVLLEDWDKKKVTARIILSQQALLEWIGIIDRTGLSVRKET